PPAPPPPAWPRTTRTATSPSTRSITPRARPPALTRRAAVHRAPAPRLHRVLLAVPGPPTARQRRAQERRAGEVSNEDPPESNSVGSQGHRSPAARGEPPIEESH